jgi:hypothetical protein
VKPLVYSYSLLNTWAICPHQCYRRYIKKDLPYVETPEMAYGNVVHKAMEQRLRGTPLPDNLQKHEPLVIPIENVTKIAPLKIEPELKLGMRHDGKSCGFFDDSVFLRGVLDVPIVGRQAAALIDWKTGKPREDPYELEIGALLLQARYTNVKIIIGRYVWLKENRLGEEHDVSDTDRTWRSVRTTVGQISDAVQTGDFPKTKGPLCKWCNCFDCENNTNPKRPS